MTRDPSTFRYAVFQNFDRSPLVLYDLLGPRTWQPFWEALQQGRVREFEVQQHRVEVIPTTMLNPQSAAALVEKAAECAAVLAVQKRLGVKGSVMG